MRLTRIELGDFAQYPTLDLNLEAVEQAAIVGENGSGKTKLMDAVLWCLYGRPTRGTTDRHVRDDRRGMWVRTTWEHAGHEVVIMRSRALDTAAGQSSLALQIDDERKTRHTIAETQEAINALIGLTREQLLAGPWMAQGRSDALMALDPAPRKALVNSLLGLDRFEAYWKKANEWLAGTDRDLVVVEDRRKRLEEIVGRELAVRRLIRDATDACERIARQEAQALFEAEELRARSERVRAQSERLAEIERELPRVAGSKAAAEAALARLEQQAGRARSLVDAGEPGPPSYEHVPEETDVERLRQRAHAAADVRARVGLLVDEKRRAQLSVDHAREAARRAEQEGLCDRCPYRGRADLPALVAAVAAIDGQLDGLPDIAASLQDEQDTIHELRMSESTRDDALRRNDALRNGWQDQADAWRKQVDDLPSLEAAVAEIRQSVEAHDVHDRQLRDERIRLSQSAVDTKQLTEELLAAATKLTTLRTASNEAAAERGAAEAALAEVVSAKAQLADAMDEARSLGERRELLAAVVRMFHRDGLPTQVLERSIPVIESRANEWLGRMPASLQVRLVTQKLTKTGTVHDTLDVDVEEAGRLREYDLLSGAERFRVDLALRLGLASMLLHRSGHGFDTLWLDEPFSAQDGRALDAMLASISAVADQFGLLLVVTHEPVVADRFPARVHVTSDDRGRADARLAA